MPGLPRRWHARSSPSPAARSGVGPESRYPCHLPRDLLNQSTNQPRRPAASSSNKPRQHDARLPHAPWLLPHVRPVATAPCTPRGYCPMYARFPRQTRLDMWIGGDCSATANRKDTAPAVLQLGDGAVLARRSRQKSMTTTLGVPRQLSSLCA